MFFFGRQGAAASEFEAKQKTLEGIAMPIMTKLYQVKSHYPEYSRAKRPLEGTTMPIMTKLYNVGPRYPEYSRDTLPRRAHSDPGPTLFS